MKKARKYKVNNSLSKTQQLMESALLHTSFAPDTLDFSGSDSSSFSTEATRDPIDKLLYQQDYLGDLDFTSFESSTLGNRDGLLPESLSLHSLPTSASLIELCDLRSFTPPGSDSWPPGSLCDTAKSNSSKRRGGKFTFALL